jgi:hypothetical protein
VRALAARSASLALGPARDRGSTLRRFSLEPIAALADAMGRCGSPEAEQTLRAWLERPAPWAEAAGIGLGRIVARRAQLEDSTVVQLLNAASRPDQPVHNALVPFSRLAGLSESAARRLVDVAVEAIEAGGRAKSLGLGAVPKAGAIAAPVLSDVLMDANATLGERSTAARGLGMLGTDGQPALRAALSELGQSADPDALRAGLWAPVLSVLRALSPPVPGGNDALTRLATLNLEGADGPSRRRLVDVRCAAASLLAGTASLSTRLVQCDPDGGSTRDLAVLDVLDRGSLIGARASRYAEIARSNDAVVRRRAIDLLTSHGEARATAEILTEALAAESPGVVAAAARVLIARPARARRGDSASRSEEDAPLEPAPALLEALGVAIDRKRAPDQIEPHGLLLRAAAALGLLSAKPKAEAACHDENATFDGPGPDLRWSVLWTGPDR